MLSDGELKKIIDMSKYSEEEEKWDVQSFSLKEKSLALPSMKLGGNMNNLNNRFQKRSSKQVIFQNYGNENEENNINDYKNETRGEIALWRAVLLQAFIDLKTKSKKHVKKPVKREAIKWFRVNKRDLMDVCVLADYDYNIVVKKAEEIMADNGGVNRCRQRA